MVVRTNRIKGVCRGSLDYCRAHAATRRQMNRRAYPKLTSLLLMMEYGFGVAATSDIFYGHGLPAQLQQASKRGNGATVFAYHVNDPQRYGVVHFDDHGRALGIE